MRSRPMNSEWEFWGLYFRVSFRPAHRTYRSESDDTRLRHAVECGAQDNYKKASDPSLQLLRQPLPTDQ